MSLKHIDMDSALRRLADKRIEDAMAEGKFDNLAGMGKPMDLEPMPADEGARMTWWMLRIMKNNNFTPDEIRWRKTVDRLKEELSRAGSENQVVRLVKEINVFVHKINTLGTNALRTDFVTLSEDVELQRFRQRA